MYVLVTEAECKRYKSDCSNVLKETCRLLKEKGITAQFSLVGNGARNLITRNGNGSYDLDYNLEIIKAIDEYKYNLKYLKDTIRICLDKASRLKCFNKSHDSTSCLTAILHFKDSPNIKFSFDVAIVTRGDDGNLSRLIHNKNILGMGYDQYVWDKIPNSKCVKEKADELKSEDLWEEVRQTYVELKK